MSIPVARLNHAVLFVRDASVAAEFYGRVFGFEIVANEMGGKAIFMRAAGGDNHHRRHSGSKPGIQSTKRRAHVPGFWARA